MVTNEIVNGQLREIDWDFVEIFERHDNNWCNWHMRGTDPYGNEYEATCQADGRNPTDSYGNVENITVV